MHKMLIAMTGAWLSALSALPGYAFADDAFTGLPDPTRPSAAQGEGGDWASTGQKGFVLQSILMAPQRRLAVINGKTLAVGERIADATVAAIRPQEVTLKRPSGDLTLRLVPRYVTRGAAAAPQPKSETQPHVGTP